MKQKNSLNLIINNESYSLTTNKMLVGSAEHADIQLSGDSISHYHAMVFVDQNGSVVVMDLESQNGTYINGEKVNSQAPIFEGDSLSFGKLHCNLIENTEITSIESMDSSVLVYEELQDNKVYVPQQTDENQVLIDDEYCDIKFDDTEFVPLFNNPLKNLSINAESYIETEEFESSFDLLEEIDGNCIQVTTSLNGNIIEQFYYPIQDGTVHASSTSHKNNVVVDILNSKVKTPLFNVSGDTITISELEEFNISQKTMQLSESSVIIISRGTYQIFVEIANVPSNLLHISSLRREKGFFKDTAKKFAAVIVPMLLLLLVDFSPEKKVPVKKLSIIYKKPTTANVNEKKMASTQANDTKKDTGHKATKQPDKKIAHSKSGAKTQPKKSQQKKVAKSQSKKSKKSKTKAKTKAYSFKMASNVSSVFSSSKSVAVTNSKTPSTVSTTSTASGSLATKVNGTSSNQVGQMGSDAAGRAAASFGSKGLSSKSGRDTAYIQTETVVLGSMDPELLRKILQQYLPQFRHCYQQELAYNSEDIKGIVDLNFEILGSGKVSKIKVRAKDSRFSKRGTNCMAKVLAIIDFPKPKGGGRVAVRQPLSFFSEQEKG
ncbi:MAG: hypothetical protein ACJAS4_000316 [Bacteriovoracaceae bacterium]|jgi:hypothetical protein